MGGGGGCGSGMSFWLRAANCFLGGGKRERKSEIREKEK